MTYASERLYNEVVRRNLARYATDVKVREILPHLPCLTLTDKEEVEAKRDSAGNYAAVQMLLDNLRRRENWAEYFINALRNCEHKKMADELSEAYDRLRGRTNNAAAAPVQAPPDSTTAATTTVTKATVHTAPVTTPPLQPPSSGNAPAQPSAPSEISAQIPPSASNLQAEQQKGSTSATTCEPPSQPEVPPPAVVPSQAPLPTIDFKVDSTAQQNKNQIQGGATENRAPTSNNPNVRTTTSSADDNILSTLSAQESSSSTSISQTSNSSSTLQISPNLEEYQFPLAVEDTFNKRPVQETNPPSNKEPTESSDPTLYENVQSTSRVGLPVKAQITSTRTPQATASAPTEVVTHCPSSVSQEILSKPGILRSPDEEIILEEPCSTTTNDLEISRTPEPSAEPTQFDSFRSSINESSNLPQEDHYESSLESQMEILTNEICIREEASAENFNGQPPSMLGNTFNPSEASGNLQYSTKMSEGKPVQNYKNTEIEINHGKPSGRVPLRPSDQERSTSINYQEQESNVLYLSAAAAAVVGIGLFMIWKTKS